MAVTAEFEPLAGADRGAPGWIERRQPGGSWRLRSDATAEFQNILDAPDLAAWVDQGRATLIKRGRERTVYRIPVGTGTTAVYCKEFVTRELVGRCRALLRGSPAAWEASRIRLAEERGLPTAALLGFAECRSLRSGIRSRLLTQAIEPVETLAAWRPLPEFPDGCPASPADDREGWISATARLLATLHGRGLWHHDLHAGNVLLRPDSHGWSAWLIDLAALRGAARTPLRQIHDNLARFWLSTERLLSTEDRRVFAQHYWRELLRLDSATARQLGNTAEAAASSLLAATGTYAQPMLRHADRAWQRENRKVMALTAGRGLARLGRDWLTWFSTEVSVLWRTGRPTSAAFPGTEARWITVPSSRGPQPLRLIRFPKSSSRSRRTGAHSAWEIGHALHRRGIQVSIPWGYVAEADGDYLALCEPAEAISLPAAWNQGTNPRELHDRVHELLTHMLRSGFEPDDSVTDAIRVLPDLSWVGWCAPEGLRWRERGGRGDISATVERLTARYLETARPHDDYESDQAHHERLQAA